MKKKISDKEKAENAFHKWQLHRESRNCTLDKEKAENAFVNWWWRKGSYGYRINSAWEEAYLAGLRAERRKAKMERKKDLLKRLKKK